MKLPILIVLTLVAVQFSLSSAWASSDLAKKNSCMSCHNTDKKLVGPAFKDVVKKYAGVPDAPKKLALSIKAGGAGKWGPVPMPPPTSLSDADATKLATWILEGAK